MWGVVEDEDGSAVVTFDAFDLKAAATQETRKHEIGSLKRHASRRGRRWLVHLFSSLFHRTFICVAGIINGGFYSRYVFAATRARVLLFARLRFWWRAPHDFARGALRVRTSIDQKS
jgi:hypothetical protein